MGSEEFTDKISILMGKRLLIKNLKGAILISLFKWRSTKLNKNLPKFAF